VTDLGLRSLLVRTGYGRKTEADPKNDLRQATITDDFPAAITWILAGPTR